MNQRPTAADQVELAFAPLHKLAMGAGIGVAAAIVVFVLTAVPLLRGQSEHWIELLSAYFAGYELSWNGAVLGAAWAGFTGFVLGWFFAFCRNVLMGIRLIVLRARADYAATRDFLDHI